MKEIKLKVNAYKDQTIMEALAAEGVQSGGTCGGRGTCGKCRVHANEKDVLACRERITEDVTVLVDDGKEDVNVKVSAVALPEGFSCDEAEAETYGVALDLGTTTIVVMLWNLAEGTLVDVEAVSNPQRVYGADVMSRIGFVQRAPWNLTRLQSSLMNEINQAMSRLMMKHGIDLGQIRKITAVGNTVMSHFFLGEDVSGLASYPFAPSFTGSVVTTARAVGIAAHEEAEVYVGPNIGGHVGSDITAGILAAGYLEDKNIENRLFFDIGTNGEIVLTSKVKSYCCSAAAGPAFEGSALYQGMRAMPGAICNVAVTDGVVHTETIGGEAAKGICGSGIIDAMSVMVKHQVVDVFGRIHSEEELEERWPMGSDLPSHIYSEEGVNHFLLTKEPAVLVTQQDVREIQMAKAAIAAGSQMLMEEAGLCLNDIAEIGIAGAFGNAIDLSSAKTIGLLPDADTSKMRALGNGAGIGASMMLLSGKCREKAEKIASSIEHVELAASADFQNRYIEEMNF